MRVSAILLAPLAAIAEPIVAPTIECVVETGIPIKVAMVNQIEEPTKAHAIVNISTAGSGSKMATSTTLFLIVSLTLFPTKQPPRTHKGPQLSWLANILNISYRK